MRAHNIRTHALIWGMLLLFSSLWNLSELLAREGAAGTQSILHEVGAGARAFGMGRAYVAFVDDPSAVYWNPAGLEYIPRIAFSLFHTPLVEGASYDFLGFVYPTLHFGTVGLGIARVGSGSDIVVTDISNQPIAEGVSFDFSEIYISYGKRLPGNLAAGLTFKVQRQVFSFGNRESSAFGVDAGWMYRPGTRRGIFKDISLGFQWLNLVKPEVKLGANDEVLASRLSLGIAKKIQFSPDGLLNASFDLAHTQSEGSRIHFGTEYNYREIGSLRLGLDHDQLVFGAGVRYKMIDIDYAFGNLSYQGDFPASHRFSFTFNLGKSRSEKVVLAEEERRRWEKELVEHTKETERQRRVLRNLSKGKSFLSKERYFDAYSEFQQVIAEDPFNKEAKVLYDSVAALIEERFDVRQQVAISRAVDKERALDNKNFIELHFQKGQLFLEKRQFTEALKELNLVLERIPNDPIILEAINTTKRHLNSEVKKLVKRAREKFQQGNYSVSLRMLSEASILSPDSRELNEAINRFANRIKIQQFIQEGLGYLEKEAYQKALSVFEEALKLDPSNQAIRVYISRTRIGLGKKQKMDPRDERDYLIGTDLFLKERYQEALLKWNRLSRKYPYNKKLQDAIKNAEDRIKRTQRKRY